MLVIHVEEKGSEHDFRRVNEHELLEKLKTEYKWVHEDQRKSLILVVGHITGAPNENIVQNHLNIASLNVF